MRNAITRTLWIGAASCMCSGCASTPTIETKAYNASPIDLIVVPAATIGVRSRVGESELIPEYSLDLTCGARDKSNPYQLTAEEQKGFVEFAEFISENQDTVVYVDVRIDQECAACGCPRAEPHVFGKDSRMAAQNKDAQRSVGDLFIDINAAAVRGEGFSGIGWGGAKMFLEGILLQVSIPDEWAVQHQIYLPRWEHLEAQQYHAGEYGTFARFDGLFTARFHGRTGMNMLHLDVLSPTDREVEQLQRIRERRILQEQGSKSSSDDRGEFQLIDQPE